jgi:hypothetical protein
VCAPNFRTRIATKSRLSLSAQRLAAQKSSLLASEHRRDLQSPTPTSTLRRLQWCEKRMFETLVRNRVDGRAKRHHNSDLPGAQK